MCQDNSVGKNSSVEKIEKWIFYFLCGYALCSSTTIAGGSVFLGLGVVTAIYRLVKQHDDWRELLQLERELIVPFLIFLGVMIITSLFSTDFSQSVDALANHYINRIMPFVLVLMFVKDKEKIVLLTVLAGISTVINEFFCILQWNGYALLRDGDVKRPGGLIGTMMTGGIVSMWVPVMALLFAESKNNKKYFVGIAMLIVVLGAIFNNTRGAWLAIVITVFVTLVVYAKSKLKVVALFVALSIALGLVIHNTPWMEERIVSMVKIDKSQPNNMERLCLWKSARNMATDYPITGVGYGCFGAQYRAKYILPEAINPTLGHAHNNFFHVLAESGYPGAISLWIWWIGTLVYCIKGWHKYKNIGYLIFMAIFLGVMLQGATEYTMGDSIVMKLFWFGIGLSYQWIRLNRESIK